MVWSKNQHLKDLSTSVATVQDHIHQIRKKSSNYNQAYPYTTIKSDCTAKELKILQSKQQPRKTLAAIFQKELDEDIFPPLPTPNTKSHDDAYIIINKDEM